MNFLKLNVVLAVMVVQASNIVEEYKDVKFRYNKLSKHLDNITNCIEDKEFSVIAPIEVYYDQLSYMLGYIKTLEKRAKFENINLN